MAYRIKQPTSIPKQVRCIAIEQIDLCVEEIEDEALDRHEAVHQVRKRFKKIRGLLRLVRPGLGKTYRRANEWFRDAGRDFSRVRDAESILEALQKLESRYHQQVDETFFPTIREELVRRRQRIADEWLDLEERLAELACRLTVQREKVRRWKLDADPVETVLQGLVQIYRRGRGALAEIEQMVSSADYCRIDIGDQLGADASAKQDEQWHEWRKACKYHWYHLRLLRPIWPMMMRGAIESASTLSDLLGDDHDLAVMSRLSEGEPDLFGSAESVAVLKGIIRQDRARLQLEALLIGRRLFANRPGELQHCMNVWWSVWREETEG